MVWLGSSAYYLKLVGALHCFRLVSLGSEGKAVGVADPSISCCLPACHPWAFSLSSTMFSPLLTRRTDGQGCPGGGQAGRHGCLPASPPLVASA